MTITNEAARFGAHLRRARLAAGLSQAALAERSTLSTAAIAALESGRRTAPRPATVALLADALGLTTAERLALLETLAAGTGSGGLATATPMPSAAVLPIQPTPLVGREREEAALLALVRRPGPMGRLVTLMGPGGVGKTRLALAVAHAAHSHFADGAVFVDLAPLHDHRLVAATTAHALGIQEGGGQSARDLLVAALREREMLVVLDNFEHLLDAAQLVAELAAASPRLSLLVTSRTALHLRAERRFHVTPLATPASDRALEEIAASPAVQLFVERARVVAPEFGLDADNAPKVAEACRRLDGLPLALELAAARIALLSPGALLARLDQRLPLLRGAAHDVPHRQQTLRSTLDWSHELLGGQEQTLFARLSVFVGGCSLAAAEAVCNLDGGLDVLTAATLLLDSSLLVRLGLSSEPRIDMLETIREYASERLEARGETRALRYQHAAYYLALVEAAAPALEGPEQAVWLERLEQDHDNLRAALGWSTKAGDVELGLRLAAGLWRFWFMSGYLHEGREWLDASLAAGPNLLTEGVVAARARVLYAAGVLALRQGDFGRGVGLAEESLAVARRLGDRAGVAATLNTLGNAARDQGDYERAATAYAESLSLRQALGDRRAVAVTLNNLGALARARGDLERAAGLQTEGLALRREVGDTWGIATVLGNLAQVLWEQGELVRATALAAESLELRQRLGDQHGTGQALSVLGASACSRGDLGEAETRYRAGLVLSQRTGDRWLTASCLAGLAGVATAVGQPRRAAYLFGAAAALHAALRVSLSPVQQSAIDRDESMVRLQLGQAVFEAEWLAGHALRLPEIMTEALTDTIGVTAG